MAWPISSVNKNCRASYDLGFQKCIKSNTLETPILNLDLVLNIAEIILQLNRYYANQKIKR
jgi:hypothetical protein